LSAINVGEVLGLRDSEEPKPLSRNNQVYLEEKTNARQSVSVPLLAFSVHQAAIIVIETDRTRP
jgi:hypothetical protein